MNRIIKQIFEAGEALGRAKALGQPTIGLTFGEYTQQQLKNCNLQNVSGSALDFYTDLMKLINAYCDKGLKKPDLIHKMEYATESCKLS